MAGEGDILHRAVQKGPSDMVAFVRRSEGSEGASRLSGERSVLQRSTSTRSEAWWTAHLENVSSSYIGVGEVN